MTVLFGGLVTLIVTLVVQVFVTPHVQARIRNRERWEGDVVELRILIEEELPRAHRDLFLNGHAVIFFNSAREHQASEQANIDRALRNQLDRYTTARDRCHELADRLSRLEGRAAGRNRHDPYWRQVTLARIAYSKALLDAWLSENPDVGLGEWDNMAEKIRQGHADLMILTREVTNTMKQPRRSTIKRFYRRVRSRLSGMLPGKGERRQ